MFDNSSQKSPEETLRLAIPSDGEMYESTLGFLSECGMSVSRGNFRHYMGQLSSLSDVVVLFQRAADITSKVEEGSADIGIVGLDRFAEYKLDDGESLTILDDLSYSRCKLVTAVPQGWLDVSEMADLADLAAEFRERGRDLRVATKYPDPPRGSSSAAASTISRLSSPAAAWRRLLLWALPMSLWIYPPPAPR